MQTQRPGTCCNTYVTDEHLCYFKIKPLKVTSGRFLYYDFETCQDSLITCDHGYKNKPRQNCQSCTPVQLCSQCRRCINCKKSYCGLEQHVPNYLVCQTTCDKCKNNAFTTDAKCDNCGDRCSKCSTRTKGSFCNELCKNNVCGRREIVFKGPETTDQFCKWLITPQHKDMTAIALEELEHFKMVHELMTKRGMVLGREQHNDYAKSLQKFFPKTKDRPTALIHRLLVAALIEARSCERFKVFSENMEDQELSKFYKDLMISEANHYTLFLGYARKYMDRKIVDQKWENLLKFEAC